MKKPKRCPYCGSDKVTLASFYSCWCFECRREFDSDDLRHEIIRQKISAICSAHHATEQHPLDCILKDEMELHISGIDEVAQGLPESMKPQVENVFQDSEGTVWITVDGKVIELDDILTDSMSEILEWLKDAYWVNPLNDLEDDPKERGGNL